MLVSGLLIKLARKSVPTTCNVEQTWKMPQILLILDAIGQFMHHPKTIYLILKGHFTMSRKTKVIKYDKFLLLRCFLIFLGKIKHTHSKKNDNSHFIFSGRKVHFVLHSNFPYKTKKKNIGVIGFRPDGNF